MHLTICYVTARKDNRFHWFVDSLRDQIATEDIAAGLRIVVVDSNAKELSTATTFNGIPDVNFIITPQKPNVWSGPHRLTKDQWFSCSNQRNSGLCFAPDGFLAYVDDLSVLGPHWLQSVREAIAGNYIVLGCYEKHKEMSVENGKIFRSVPYSHDSRLFYAKGDITSCGGDFLYGCSLAGPVQAFLDVNGFPEMCDSCGSEDYCMGIAIGNLNRYSFRFDRRMKTVESEELHYAGEVYRKSDYGQSPNDFSHSLLNIAKQSKWFPHYLGDGFSTISDLRAHVLAGGEFPIRRHPEHHPYTKQLLSEL